MLLFDNHGGVSDMQSTPLTIIGFCMFFFWTGLKLFNRPAKQKTAKSPNLPILRSARFSSLNDAQTLNDCIIKN